MSGNLGELITAANEFRSTLLPKADHLDQNGKPMWYSWALRMAFIAGYEHATDKLRKEQGK